MIRIGISGFGRIGRLAARVALRRGDMEVVAINAPDKTPEQIAYVFSHDSVHGKWEGTVSYDEHHLIVDGKPILLLSSRDPSTLGWGELNVPYVVECTGKFLTAESVQPHLDLLRRSEGRLRRFLHHQLPRSHGEGPARQLRHR